MQKNIKNKIRKVKGKIKFENKNRLSKATL